MHEIPVIDLQGLETKEGQQQIAMNLREVYSEIGFATVINHGIPERLIDDMFACSQAFHALPLAEKMAIQVKQSLRGYIPMNHYTFKKTGIGESTVAANKNDSLAVVAEFPEALAKNMAGTDFSGHNQWPESLPSLRATVLEYMDLMTNLSHQLLRDFSIAMGLPAHALDHFVDPQPIVNLRMLHYPARVDWSSAGALGIGAHSDYGLLTRVTQDSVGGLQVRTPDNNHWLDVEPHPNAIVLNTADCLTRLSHGLLRSTPHRVLSPTAGDRFSQAFYLSPCFDASLKPLTPCVVQSAQPPQYSDTTYRQYFSDIIAHNYQYRAGSCRAD